MAKDTSPESYLAWALEECLEALDKGERDIEALVARYPQEKEELKPLLEIAAQLKERRIDVKPSPTFILRLRRQLLTAPKRSL